MIRLSHVFWTIAALDALFFVVALVMTLSQSSHQDGGREMALFFFIFIPSAVLLAACAMFHFSGGVVMKYIALFIVTVPALFWAKLQIEDVLIDRSIELHRKGVGYFSGKAMQAMGAAVVNRDVETLKRIGPTVDVNTVGDRQMTLLALAVDESFGPSTGKPDAAEMAVVSTLLALGAKPEQALDSASKRDTTELLEVLLDAGANPNMKIPGGQPMVFSWTSVLKPASLRLMAKHGLDLNITSYDDPLPVVLTIYKRWDLLAVLIELGADTRKPRPDGRNVADELASQIDEEVKAGNEPPAELLRVKAMLDASRARS